MKIEHIHWSQLCPGGESLHMARIETPQGASWNLHRHDFFECFWVEAGSGWHELESGSLALKANQLWFVRPEHAHGFRMKTNSNPPCFVNLAMEATLVEAFLKRHAREIPRVCWAGSEPFPSHVVLSPGQALELKRLLASVSAEGRRSMDAEWFLCGLIRLLQTPGSETLPAHAPLWLKESLFLLRQPQHFRHGVPRLVELCDRSPAHVARVTRQSTGKSPGQWVMGFRMHHAATLLQTTDLSVTEVALEVGMENLSHFHKVFRAYYQLSPLRYRRTHASGIMA